MTGFPQVLVLWSLFTNIRIICKVRFTSSALEQKSYTRITPLQRTSVGSLHYSDPLRFHSCSHRLFQPHYAISSNFGTYPFAIDCRSTGSFTLRTYVALHPNRCVPQPNILDNVFNFSFFLLYYNYNISYITLQIYTCYFLLNL